MIPYGKQNISKEDIDAVIEVLNSDFLTQGPVVERFEKELCDYTSSEYALALNSATSALHCACLALGVSKGDLVWTSPITFVASANCALYCGADIDFVDIDYESNNISIEALRLKLENAEANNRLPKVIIPVHMGGESCDMKSIYKLSQKYGFKIIEDASHSIGATYNNSKVGSCKYSDITVFSFHPVKIITTAEGGAALTNNKNLFDKLQLFRSHGITREVDNMKNAPHGGWYYEQIDLGLNYRMTELQAALGCSQIKRIENFVLKRNNIAEFYNQEFCNLPIDLPKIDKNSISSYHLYIIKISSNNEKERLELYSYLKENGLGVNVHYIPVHMQPYYRSLGFSNGDFPEAERYYKSAISIPLHPGLTKSNQNYIVKKLRNFFL